MKTLLGSEQTFVDEHFHGIRAVLDYQRQITALGWGKVLEYVIRSGHPPGRPAHSHTYPEVVLRAQRLADIPQAIVAAFTAAAL